MPRSIAGGAMSGAFPLTRSDQGPQRGVSLDYVYQIHGIPSGRISAGRTENLIYSHIGIVQPKPAFGIVKGRKEASVGFFVVEPLNSRFFSTLSKDCFNHQVVLIGQFDGEAGIS